MFLVIIYTVSKGPGMSTSSYIPFVFLISSVIGLLQVEKALKAHPANMWISVTALVIFCFSRATKKKITQSTRWARCSPIVDAFRVLSGTLVAVSLTSIFLPDCFWWLFFIIWVLLTFVVIYLRGMKAFQIDGTYRSAARCFA
jgi:uncharacterized membrane protein SirB2